MGQIIEGIQGSLQLHHDDHGYETSDDDAEEAAQDLDPHARERIRHLEEAIQAEQHEELNHKAAKTPRIVNPFKDRPATQRVFERLLHQRSEERYIPQGYGFVPWAEADKIKVGKRKVSARGTLPEKPAPHVGGGWVS